MLLFYKEGKIQVTGPYTVGTAVFLAQGVFFLIVLKSILSE